MALQQSDSRPSPPGLFRINGVGTTLAGRLDDPTISPWYYKQLVVTFVFVPIWLGRTYVVMDAGKGGGWFFAGTATGGEIASRLGWRAYWLFKARALFRAAAVVMVIAVIVGGPQMAEHYGLL